MSWRAEEDCAKDDLAVRVLRARYEIVDERDLDSATALAAMPTGAAMQAAVQPYVCSAISNTASVASDFPFTSFANLAAWRQVLKGLTACRLNDRRCAVLRYLDGSEEAGGGELACRSCEASDSWGIVP